MAQASFGQLVDPQEEAIQRQRQYAQALRQQAMQPMEQQVVSGRVVPFSVTQGLANMLKAYAGRKGEEDADTRALELGTRKRTQGAAELQGIVEALRGKPAIPSFQTGANEMGDESVMQNPVAAQAPDQNKALAMALASQNPVAQQIGGTLLTASLPKAPKMERVEVPDGKGGKRVGFVDMNSPNPMSTFQEGGAMPVKQEFVNGQAVNPYGVQPGTTIPKQLDPTDPRRDLLVPGPDGQLVPNAPLVGLKKDIAKSGASSVNVNADKSYFGNVAEGMAKNDVAAIEAGRSAPERVATARRVKEILSRNPITGTGAEARLAINKALATAGIVDGTNVADTEVLASSLANQALDAIKTSGLGGGNGFSNADRDFLERARAGKIDMNSQSLARLADLNERAALASVQRANSIIETLKKSPQSGSMAQQLQPIQIPSVVRNATPAPATQAPQGARFLGFE